MLLFIFKIAIAVVEVHINMLLPAKLLKRMAEKRVIRQIHYAYNNIPYYKKKYDRCGIDINSIKSIEDIKKLPFITKDEIRENYPDGIVSNEYDVKKCHYSATTGSTGRSLPFIYSKSTFAFYIATGVRLYTMIGFRPWHKTVYIKYTPINYPKIGPFFNTGHIPSTIPVEEQISQLKQMKPDLLIGYSSIILEIAQKVTPEDKELIKPKFIGLNSELSTKHQRDFISSVFKCPVYDEYSTEETWMIASQCKAGNYHMFTDNIWVEFLNEDGEQVKPGEDGEIFLTTLRSPAMPFIRYKIGDIGSYSRGQCSCGLGFPVLTSFEGRADDSFILSSGKTVSSLKLLNTFTKFIKKYLHLMEEFKVIQKERGYIIIQLIKGKEYREEQFQEVIQSLKDILQEPVSIEIEFVDKIDNDNGIKRKAIESWVNKKKEPCLQTS